MRFRYSLPALNPANLAEALKKLVQQIGSDHEDVEQAFREAEQARGESESALSTKITQNADYISDSLKSLALGDGAWKDAFIPYVRTDGVAEVGKYIDFHADSAGSLDYDARLEAGSGSGTAGAGELYLNGSKLFTAANLAGGREIKVDYGIKNCTYSQGPTSNAVTFNLTFTSPPAFFAGNVLGASGSNISAQVSNVTKSGAQIDCYHPSAIGTRDVPWFAIGI